MMVVEHIPPRWWWRRARWRLVDTLHIGASSAPAGFVSDGTSVPRLLLPLFSTTGRAMAAAIIHDYALSRLDPTTSRASADHAFRAALAICGVAPWRADILYFTVRGWGVIKVALVRMLHHG